MKRVRKEGLEALRHKPPPGAPSRLSDEQRARLPELLAQGAQAHGFRGELWTCERVAVVIRREFGVSYHPAHVSRVVRALGLSLQKPQRRAEQRDEEAIDYWKQKKWPSLKKGRKRKAEPLCLLISQASTCFLGWGSHLRSGGTDTNPQGASQPRSPLSDERHHPRRQTLHVRAGACLQGRGCGALPKAPFAPDRRQAAPHMGPHMGRLSDTSGRSGQDLSVQRSVKAA
jgi:transposase